MNMYNIHTVHIAQIILGVYIHVQTLNVHMYIPIIINESMDTFDSFNTVQRNTCHTVWVKACTH